MRMVKGFLVVASLIFLIIAAAHASRFQEWVVSVHYSAQGILFWLVMTLVPLALSVWGFASLRRIGR